MSDHVVCDVTELPAGERKIVKIGRISVGVFNIEGKLYAVRNICPHHGAELCLGKLSGTMMPSSPGEWDYADEGMFLRCPRHRWEFDVRTGQSFTEPGTWRVKVYPVRIRDEKVVVEV
jgi:3-phenylpropionate/trans-cinnamate dioxygenase ferredoxin subunit